MDDGQKLTDIVRAEDRAEVKHPGTCGQVDGLVFHYPGIARAGGVHRPRVGPYLRGQRKYGVVAVVGRIGQRLSFGHNGQVYMRSGTSMPSRAMPFLIILATLAASTSRSTFFSSLSAFRMLKSW